MIIENIRTKRQDFISAEDWNAADPKVRARFRVINREVQEDKTPAVKEVLAFIKSHQPEETEAQVDCPESDDCPAKTPRKRTHKAK